MTVPCCPGSSALPAIEPLQALETRAGAVSKFAERAPRTASANRGGFAIFGLKYLKPKGNARPCPIEARVLLERCFGIIRMTARQIYLLVRRSQ